MIEPNERTYTASQSADAEFVTWIRDGNGRVSLDDAALEVVIRPYPRGHDRLTVEATGTADGQVTWAITTEQARQLGRGLYQIIIRRADKGELLHRGTLEVQF